MMERHFVTFYSPGTFVHETTTKPIAEWSTVQARELARGITERYGQTPFAFSFSTRAREDDELDSHMVRESGMYYLGGKVENFADVEKADKHSTLAWNMKANGIKEVITVKGVTKILRKDDVILEAL